MPDDTCDRDARTGRRTGSEDPRTGLASTSRRQFLRAAASAGAVLGGFGLGAGSSAARGAPTPWLDREGNLLRDPSGQQVILRGVSTADPKRVNVTAPARGKDVRDVIDLATDEREGWHARAIRLPVQPVDVGEHEPGQGPQPPAFTEEELEAYCEEHLDGAVQACERNGAYAIVDYHRHRDIQWNDPALADEIELFWDLVADRYGGRPHVLFELYNEPQTPGMWGPIDNPDVRATWRQWIETAQPWVDTIREHAPRNLVLIGSPSWSQSPEGALIEEFDGRNLAYTYHIYPGHGVSQNEAWDEDASWENGGEPTNQVYEEVPLFVTEFGWEEGAGDVIGGTTSGFGEPFRDWLESGPIHWTAWCFDPVWRPVMWERAFTDAEDVDSIGNPYEEEVPELCEMDHPHDQCEWTLLGGDSYMGEFVRDFLADRADDDVPIHRGAPGRSGDAPGQGGDAPGRSGDAPGRSGGAPGRSGDAPGRSGDAPGRSSNASGETGDAPWQRGRDCGDADESHGWLERGRDRAADGGRSRND